MTGRRSNYAQALDEGDAPMSLYKHLAVTWAVPDSFPAETTGRSTRSSEDPSTGAVAATGLPVFEALRNLVTRNVEGISKITLLAANEAGEVSLLHSLFVAGSNATDYSAGSLYALRGEIPTEGLPTVVRLEAIHFASNYEFLGTARLEFIVHLAGVNSVLPRDLEDQAHEVAAETDEGSRTVRSRGLAFVPRRVATAVLDGDPSPTVASVCCDAYEALSKEDRAFDGGVDWLQASLTAQADGTYLVRTYRDPTVVPILPNSFLSHYLDGHLRELFPGQYLPAATEADVDRIRGGIGRTKRPRT